MAFRRATSVALASASVLGVLAGAASSYVAGVHNPQHEFFGAEWSEPSSLLFLGLAAFGATMVIAYPLCLVAARFLWEGGRR
jgi:hypothetical protein